MEKYKYFIKGMFNIFGNLNPFINSKYFPKTYFNEDILPKERDNQAIASDWKKIGKELSSVVQ